MVKATPPIVDCGHAAQPSYYTAGTRIHVGDTVKVMTGDEVMFPGYAVLEDDRKVCPDCADDIQREALRTTAAGERFTAYLSSDGQWITTWTGGHLAEVVRLTRNERQSFVRARDAEGCLWAGIGPAERGTYITLRRIKNHV